MLKQVFYIDFVKHFYFSFYLPKGLREMTACCAGHSWAGHSWSWSREGRPALAKCLIYLFNQVEVGVGGTQSACHQGLPREKHIHNGKIT